ncbi:Alpha N-terminal protein methyltransferase 1 [Hypocenomyce scalaris]|nr:Alpha N-terminal protein methyltransferase 1 [Hypocenomyce scalaris]
METSPLPPDAQISHSDALSYWSSISPTVTGMLGGYPQISRIDLRGSANFLGKLRRQSPTPNDGPLSRGVDCGAGIGRVTAGFLSKVCDVVDVVEPIEKFAMEVRGAEMAGDGRVGHVYIAGLEEWTPGERRYNLIWNQWCLGHLTDVQLVEYLERSKAAVTEGGWIVVKENMSTNEDGEDIFDEVDSSVTRTDRKFRALFGRVGLRIVKTELQTGFPKGLYPVRFYALQPEQIERLN